MVEGGQSDDAVERAVPSPRRLVDPEPLAVLAALDTEPVHSRPPPARSVDAPREELAPGPVSRFARAVFAALPAVPDGGRRRGIDDIAAAAAAAVK
jgi:hypothetical protein